MEKNEHPKLDDVLRISREPRENCIIAEPTIFTEADVLTLISKVSDLKTDDLITERLTMVEGTTRVIEAYYDLPVENEDEPAVSYQFVVKGKSGSHFYNQTAIYKFVMENAPLSIVESDEASDEDNGSEKIDITADMEVVYKKDENLEANQLYDPEITKLVTIEKVAYLEDGKWFIQIPTLEHSADDHYDAGSLSWYRKVDWKTKSQNQALEMSSQLTVPEQSKN